MIKTGMHELTRIEPAVIEDLPLLTELLMDLFRQEPDFRPDYSNQMRGLRLILEQHSRGRLRNHPGGPDNSSELSQAGFWRQASGIRRRVRQAERFSANHVAHRPG